MPRCWLCAAPWSARGLCVGPCAWDAKPGFRPAVQIQSPPSKNKEVKEASKISAPNWLGVRLCSTSYNRLLLHRMPTACQWKSRKTLPLTLDPSPWQIPQRKVSMAAPPYLSCYTRADLIFFRDIFLGGGRDSLCPAGQPK